MPNKLKFPRCQRKVVRNWTVVVVVVAVAERKGCESSMTDVELVFQRPYNHTFKKLLSMRIGV